MNASTNSPNVDKIGRIFELRAKALGAIKGTRGAPVKRAIVDSLVNRIQASMRDQPRDAAHEWAARQTRRGALGLARMAEMAYDEHGSARGDYLSTTALDYVAPADAKAAPFCDMGGGGLGLVEVTRRRVYAKSSKWYPKSTSTRYLVGRNESGTFFAHAVPSACRSIRDALNWMWGGRSEQIVRRQGDIAVIAGAGPKFPVLPSGHAVDGDRIVHATHPAIALPGKGERVIVARRAVARASNETRD